jgi:hypothetical protein
MDRKALREGPWTGEPDFIAWSWGSIACVAKRHSLGAWCGFVGLPSGHPWWGKEWIEPPPDVHGGLSFSGTWDGFGPLDSLGLWWLGFDCLHVHDYVPYADQFITDMMRLERISNEYVGHDPPVSVADYRDIGYVTIEVNRLAGQAALAAGWVEQIHGGES